MTLVTMMTLMTLMTPMTLVTLMTLGPLLDNSGTTLGSFWDHSAHPIVKIYCDTTAVSIKYKYYVWLQYPIAKISFK